MTLSKNELSDHAIDIPEGIAAIRIDKKTGNVSKSFENSYFEYFLEENVESVLNLEKKDSELNQILN